VGLHSIFLHSIDLLLERFDESLSMIVEELGVEDVDFLPDQLLCRGEVK